MLNFQRVRQQLIKLSLITLSLSLTLIALPILKQSLAFQAQAAGITPVITSVSPDSGSILGGETVTIYADNLDPGTVWEQISAGSDHTCALDATGKAYCWGSDRYGQLGDGGDNTSQSSPVAVDSSLSFSQISAGDYHTCALDTTGKAYCWGEDYYGQLGDGGTNTAKSSPVEVDSSLSFGQIAAGGMYTCALDTTGKAYCWGSDDSGQLGDSGTNTNQSSPVEVDSGLSFGQITGGDYHTCALDITGKAYCWGADWQGQLGDGGDNTSQSSPVEVDSSLSFGQIAGGDFHTCALDTNGNAYCWGSDSIGQLGDGGGNTNQPSPVAVDSDLSFSQIVTGRDHTCALDTTGKAYCWGADYIGQLGDGGTNTSQSSQPSPVAVNSGLSFGQIAGGDGFTCALDTTGKAYCWGRNDYGQLGSGGNNTNQPSPVAVNSGLSFSQISSGYRHTCALATTSKAYCWGYDDHGQLGDGGGNTDQSTPVAVDSSLSFSQIGAGTWHTCALDTTGQAYCWGYDESGQLGDGGGNTDQSTPVAVDSSLSFSQISTGNNHTCALDITGKAWCWGYDWQGQLGDGELDGWNSNKPSPVAIDSNLFFSQISAGNNHTCALDTTGQAYCWGYDNYGQLGDADTNTDQSSPVAVNPSLSFSQISAGDSHTCAIDTAGKAYCWGYDRYGRLGDGGTDTDQSSPVAVNPSLSFSQISAGDSHTCAIDTAGKAYCWGSDEYGRLGDGGDNISRSSPVAVDSTLSFSQITTGYGHTCTLDTTDKAYCWGAYSNGQLGNNSIESRVSPVSVLPLVGLGLPNYLVNFGTVTSPAFNVTNTSLQTIAPAHATGPVDVFITNLETDATSNTLVNGYTYIDLDEPTDPTNPNSPTSPATGYGPGIKLTSVSNFLFPSLVITLIGAGMLVANKKFINK